MGVYQSDPTKAAKARAAFVFKDQNKDGFLTMAEFILRPTKQNPITPVPAK